MKKLLLGLGTVSLAILPVAAMVSCSTTETTLDTEATKFTVSLEAKTPATTTTEAVKSIMDGKDAPARLLALETLVGKDKLPTIADGFTFEVKSAMVNSKTDTTVDVKITITETDSTETVKTKDATLSITKLTEIKTTIETEFAKINREVQTITPHKTAIAAASSIITPIGMDEKMISLRKIADFPSPANGFTFEVNLVTINSITPTTIDVKITITETDGGKTKDATLSITNLIISPTLSSEIAKINVTISTKTPDITIAEALLMINNPISQEEKKNALSTLVNIPLLSEGFTFLIQTAEVSQNEIIVGIKVSTIITLDIFESTVLKITGFK